MLCVPHATARRQAWQAPLPTAAAGLPLHGSMGGRLAALAGGAAAQLLGQLLLAQLAALVLLQDAAAEGGALVTAGRQRRSEGGPKNETSTSAPPVPAPSSIHGSNGHTWQQCSASQQPGPASCSVSVTTASAVAAAHRLGLDRLVALRQDQLNVAGAGHVGVDAAVRTVGPA